MKIEDYNEYYIQGSDHYLIPKDVFIELFEEMENWKEESKELNQKYLNAVADYETTMFEKEQLKKQLKDNWNELTKWVIEQEQKAWDEVSSTFGYVLNKMQELEKGSDSDE